MNLLSALRARNALTRSFRCFFEERSYEEIVTPIVVHCPGTETYLDYFETHWLDQRKNKHSMWLRSSPELHMKKALAFGLPAIFQLAPCFRNGGELGPWHNPEFTMLEWYKVGLSFHEMIQETQDLLHYSFNAMKDYGLKTPLVLPSKFDLITVTEAFKEFADLDLWDGDSEFAKKARGKGFLSVREDDDFETAYFKVLIDAVEPALTKLGACVLYDYPPSQAALARMENGAAKRFEIYIRGIELCNGFDELLHVEENRKRVQETNEKRRLLGKAVTGEDESFYEALSKGIPPCSGNALGFDRWLCILLGEEDIHHVLMADVFGS
ncbi:MAG: EF-P lysine aminoacylase GenX [Oligoflexales bacterium]|nr:EF-P lysine aminoacylase GenX [Oligoflexales bacterium]